MEPRNSRVETLDFAERWLRVGLEINQPPTFFQVVDVDMSKCRALRQTLTAAGAPVTYTHMLVHAIALTVAAFPDLHWLVYGNRRYFPKHVNLGLMVSGGMFAAPMMTIRNVDQKNLLEVAYEVIQTAPKTRDEGARQLAFLRRWGWIVPCDFLRRPLLRWIQGRFQKTHPEELLSFVISTSPGVEQLGGFVFGSAAEIMSGAVRDKVIAVEGQPMVRPVWTLTCIVDHRVWDGQSSQKLLLHLKNVLETASLILPETISWSSTGPVQ